VQSGKEKAITSTGIFEEDGEKPRQINAKVLGPYLCRVKKGSIKCPECGEEILITATLRQMNEAIEDHVQLHKEEPESNLLLKYAKPISVRLDLVKQVLYQI
jgi:hypothetical protein